MSAWMITEIVRCGGKDRGIPLDESEGSFQAQYRGCYLAFEERDGTIDVALVADFCRWGNSRIYKGEAPTTIEELDAIINNATRAKEPCDE